jgi:hypothetical protein
MSNQQQLLNKAIKLRELMEDLITDIRAAPGSDVNKEVVDALSPSLALLSKIIIKDVHQKAGEVVFKKENAGFEVLAGNHGADLRDNKGGSWEHKGSIVRGPLYRCNFNFPVPKGETDAERRKALLDSIQEKTHGGGVVLQVLSARMEVLHEYKFDQEIAKGYFARITLGKCGNHNMGCPRCKDCAGYHRLDALMKLQEKKSNGKRLTEQDWAVTMKPQATNCGVRKS